MSDVDDKLNEKLARAWRDASREEPPAALDASLRAAARRAVQAGPGHASQERHMRSWPLATAAVLAVLSFGILQLTPPEEFTPGMVAENNVKPSLARQAEKAASGAEPAARLDERAAAAPPPALATAPPSTPTATSAPTAPPAPASPFPAPSASRIAPSYAQPDAMTGSATGRVAGPTSSPPAGAEKKVLREAAPGVDAERDRGTARTQFAQAPSPTPAPSPSPSAPAAATAPAKEELAKDKPNRVDALAALEGGQHTELTAARSRLAAKDDKAFAAAPAANAGAPAATPPAAPAARPDPFPAAGSANNKAVEVEPQPPEERAKLRASADSAAAPAAAAAGTAKPQASADTRRAEQMQQSAAPAPLAKSVVPADAVKDAPIKPPEEWIKLIRKLRNEGRNDDAARELAAFRAAYKERAEALLPADLRAGAR
ncbi:MAG: hypothetical protein ABI981_07390 [Betaproteobacteria bacterium]